MLTAGLTYQAKDDVRLMRELRLELYDLGYPNIFLFSEDQVIDLFVKFGRAFDEQFVLNDKNGRPLSRVPYTARYIGEDDTRGRTSAGERKM